MPFEQNDYGFVAKYSKTQPNSMIISFHIKQRKKHTLGWQTQGQKNCPDSAVQKSFHCENVLIWGSQMLQVYHLVSSAELGSPKQKTWKKTDEVESEL